MKDERRDLWLGGALSLYLVTSLFSQALMSVGAAVLFVALVVLLPRKEFAFTREDRIYLRASIFLSLACALSLVLAKLNPAGYGGKFVRVSLLVDPLKLWYLFWPFFLVAALQALSPGARMRAFRSWLIAFAILSGIGIVQFFTGWPRPQPSSLVGHYHATLFLGHHLSVASIWIFPFFLALDAVQDPRLAHGFGFSRRALGGIALLGLGTLIFTWSRTLWIALPIGILVWAGLALPRKVSAAIAGLGAFGAAGLSFLPAIRARFGDVYGLITREDLWLANLEFFRTRPVLGVGWRHNNELSGYYFELTRPRGNVIFAGHAHNNFLDALSGTGALGALAWAAWCAAVFWITWKKPRYPGARALLCAWIVFQVNGLTQLNFWEGKVTHQMMIAVAFTLWARREEALS